MKGKCRVKEQSERKPESSLPYGAATSTVGGSSKIMLRDSKEK